jgi:DNA-binding response OmpR family regulator
MNSVKKVLLVHGDPSASRTLTLLLAGAGCYVRPCAQPEAALEAAHGEWFDLALVADPLPEMSSFGFIEALKKLQPSLAVLLLVNQLELPAVIKGIRVAVTDVLAPDGDWALVLQRVNAILGLDRPSLSGETTPAQLAEVEAILSAAGGAGAEAAILGEGRGGAANDGRTELARLARQRDSLKSMVERLAQEKTVLEAELKKQRVQQTDAVRQQTEQAQVKSEREIVAAAQAAVDEKARAVAEAREALARERSELAAERAQGRPQGEVHRLKTAEALSDERQALENQRTDLRADEVCLREEAAKVRQGQVRLDIDRRQLQEAFELLREQETNLRAYEQRLRAMGEEAEAARVQSAAPRQSRDPFQRDATLEAAWTRLNRAMDMLEAERRNFTSEKLVLKEELAQLKAMQTALRQREEMLEAREAQLTAPPAGLPAGPVADPVSSRASFTRTPFKAARAIFSNSKK